MKHKVPNPALGSEEGNTNGQHWAQRFQWWWQGYSATSVEVQLHTWVTEVQGKRYIDLKLQMELYVTGQLDFYTPKKANAPATQSSSLTCLVSLSSHNPILYKTRPTDSRDWTLTGSPQRNVMRKSLHIRQRKNIKNHVSLLLLQCCKKA